MKVIIFTIGILAVAMMAGCVAGAPFYLVKQGIGQARIVWHRQKIDTVLETDDLTNEQRRKLVLMKEIETYARNHFLLNDTKSFHSFVKTEGEAVSYLVMAAPELRLESVRWWFPVTGDVPYLGFFDKSDADQFDAYLKDKGFDVDRGEAAAYSTLGWFSDPVFSSQLKYSDAYLVGLVIHEMTHSTVWVPDQTSFNEAFASFVEEKGRELYYYDKEGTDSSTLRRLQKFREEQAKLNEMIDVTEAQLKSIYTSDQNETEMRKNKKVVLADFKKRLLASAPEFSILDLKKLAESDWNNASFTSRSVYRSDWPSFQNEFDHCDQNLVCFIEKYRSWAKHPEDHPERWQPELPDQNLANPK